MDEQEANIGAYQIRGRLGSGGMGEVFLAYDERLRRHVAIKRIRNDVETTTTRRRRLRREARAAASLNHPAIVQIYDIVESDAGDTIVMEYVEGRTLHRLLAEGEVGARQAVDLARQVATGLSAAHQRGMVHRDLKAENVMVMPDGRARILDFGLAKPAASSDPDASLTLEGAVLGTLRAMSPEQATGQRADARSDLYSLGILLFEMLAGRSPFAAGTVGEIYNQIVHLKAPLLSLFRPELPAPLSALVEDLLAKDPSQRPRSAKHVADELANILDLPLWNAVGSSTPGATPAGLDVTPSNAPTLVPSDPPTPAERLTPQNTSPMKRSAWIAVGIFAAVSALAVTTFMVKIKPATQRILVLRPELINANDSDHAELSALGVQEATFSALRALRGLEPLAQVVSDDNPVSTRTAARAAAADEAIAATLHFRDGSLMVSLRRISSEDNSVQWNSGLFEVPNRTADLLQLADAVASHLRRAYPRHRPRPGSPVLEVLDEDYKAYLEIRRRTLTGRPFALQDLDAFDNIVESSPRFLPAFILAAEAARVLKQFDRARRFLDQAHQLTPKDPRPLFIRSMIELDDDRVESALVSIAELERLAPGGLRLMEARARLLEVQGRSRDAADAWRRLVEARPSIRNLLQLARITRRLGNTEEARTNLTRALEISPRNPLTLSNLAHLEMLYGELETAEALYVQLCQQRPHRNYLTNLGNVHYLRRDFAAAAEAYRRALELEPGNRMARLNLADAELAVGRESTARALYQGLCAELADDERARGQEARPSLIHAQCLVRQGDAGQAVEITQRTLIHHPKNASATLQAALVYTLAGERHSAVASAREALALGVQKRWFEAAVFDPLRSEPGFLELF